MDLSGDDFFSAPYGTIWETFIKMYRKEGLVKIDPVTLAEKSGVLDAAQLVDAQITSASVNRQMVESVLRHSAARSLISQGQKSLSNLMDGADPYEEAVELERFSAQLGSSKGILEQEALTLQQLAENAESIAPTIIPGMCNRDFRTLVVAEEGAGKSLLLRTIAMTTAQGIHPFTHKPIDPKRALIVDLENPAQSILDTAVGLDCILETHSADYDAERLRIWRKPGGINIRRLADRAALQREIAMHQPELVCIGPIYKMYSRTSGESYEDSADEAMSILDDLRTRYNFALYMEHHAAKGRQGEGRDLSPMGSQRWMAWPEIGISLYKDKNDPTSFDVKRFRGDRLAGVRWPDRITRSRMFLVDGVYMDNGGAYGGTTNEF
jgi:replicative DNA helicase